MKLSPVFHKRTAQGFTIIESLIILGLMAVLLWVLIALLKFHSKPGSNEILQRTQAQTSLRQATTDSIA